MRHKVPSQQQDALHTTQARALFSSPATFSVSATLFLMTVFMFGCVSPQTKAWNHYEEGMLLVYKGYDAKGDKVDKVEKAFNKAIECNKDIPGVRASLGTYKAKKGETSSAMELWSEEVEIHPESKKAMDIVLEKNKDDKDVLATAAAEIPEKPATIPIKPVDEPIELPKL